MTTIPELRIKALASLGISPPLGSVPGSVDQYSRLDPNDKIKVTNWMSAYVVSNPAEFTPAQVNVADGVDNQGYSIEEMEDYGFGEQLDDFIDEAGNQAVEVIGTPLANIGKSFSYLTNWLPVAALVVGFLILKKQKLL